VQAGAINCIQGLGIGGEEEADRPGRDLDAGRLSTLLAKLPSLTSITSTLRADLHSDPTAAAVRAFLAGAARAIGRCSSLQRLHLRIVLLGGLSDQLPKALVRELAGAHALEEFALGFAVCKADRPRFPAAFSLAHVVTGLAGLSRLRALTLAAQDVGIKGELPASVSRLAQLIHLSLFGFDGLRCAHGWARLPALARLEFGACVFAADGEAALPGMDELVSLTSFDVRDCPSLRTLPASVWRLAQLHHLSRTGGWWQLPRSQLPVASLPLSAPCFASLTRLALEGHNLPVFPPGILAATRLAHLNLSFCCFGQLPKGVSVLTGLEELHLGRHSMVAMEVGGAFDARALGSLTRFPHLHNLSFANCSVLFCSDFQAAAAHPCLECFQLRTSYPESGPSWTAFLGFVSALLQRGRVCALCLDDIVVQGTGRRNSHNFRAALEAVGYPLSAWEKVVYIDDDSVVDDDDDVDEDGDDAFSSDGE
jgi:hypothetical protein